MAAKLGSIKSISGQTEVIAVDKSGNERILKVGDSLYEGESIKTTSADAKVVIVANDGKEVSMVGKDTISLDPKEAANAQSANPEVAALQNALLNGANITDLEETAAGGNAAAGGAGGDGVSLGAASFAEGGHYANINENFRNLTDANRAFDSFNSPVGGYADNNDNGEGDNVTPQNPANPTNPTTPVTPATPATPVALSVSLDGSGEAREATPNEYLVYNLGLSAATSSTTPTDLTLNLSGASAGRDYSNAMEYSLDGGHSWTAIQNGGTISGVAPSDIANVKVRVQVIDDYGQTAGNQNEGTSSEDLGANIAPGIKDYGVYKEGVTLSVTTNNAAITSGEAEGKIIDNDDNINITENIDASTEGLNPALVNSDPDNGNTMKTIIDTKDGDDTITIKEEVYFSSGLYDLKENANDVIKMGDGDDVFNTGKDAVVENTRIDLGNAGGEKNQDTLNINGTVITDTRFTSHDGNDVFTIKDDSGPSLGSTILDNVLFKTGSGTSAKGGFLFALSLAPAVMLALGFVALFVKYHALYAASRLLTPVLKPLIGIPGCCSISLIASTQSTDAGSSTAKFLRQDGLITHKELLIFAAFQFSAGAMITNFLSSFAPVLLVTDKAGNTAPATIAMVLGIVFVFKILGANLMRLYVKKFVKDDEE